MTLWCVLSAAPGSDDGAAGALHYRVTRPPKTRTLEVEVKRVEGASHRFDFGSGDESVKKVTAATKAGKTVELKVSSDGDVVAPEDWVTLRYRYDFDAVARAHGEDLFWGIANGDDFVTHGRAWILRPAKLRSDLRVTLEFSDPNVLLPWAATSPGRYELPSLSFRVLGFNTFGGERCELKVGQGALDVAVLGDPKKRGRLTKNFLCDWVKTAAKEVTTVRRDFPVKRVAVTVVGVPGDEPSPFGRVLYSEPPSIGLLFGFDADPKGFATDWVAVHEMFHLAHPSDEPEEPWLTEGLATYYEELARGRSGRHTPEQTWQEIVDGFDRGQREAGNKTMRELMQIQSGYYRAIYWTGALFHLELDLEIRRATQGQKSLDDVLDRLGAQSEMSRADFAAAVKHVSGQPLFDTVLERRQSKPAFSARDEILAKLGVKPGKAGVKLVNSKESPLRDALLRPRAAP